MGVTKEEMRNYLEENPQAAGLDVVLLVAIEKARQARPRAVSPPPGRRPLVEAELALRLSRAADSLAADGIKRPTQAQLAEQAGIGVRTLGTWLQRFPGLRTQLA